MKKLKIAVIYGGVSGEHEVSLKSAAAVMAGLDKKRYDVLPVKIGKNGRAQKSRDVLACDVAFPLIHGTGGEDGSLQGVLELGNIPYVGSGVLGSAIGMDKVIQKQILERAGFPIARYEYFLATDWQHDAQSIVARIEKRIGYPCFVKPANLGSSVGISKAHHQKELRRGIIDALRYDRKIVVEKGVPEAREIECAMLGNDEPRASVLGEIVPSNEFYDYAAKYIDGASREIIPAQLSKTVATKIRTMATRAFVTLNASGFSRIDFFVRRDTGDIYFNEINTIPGFTTYSMFPKLWAASGVPFTTLLDELIRLALERAAEKRILIRTFDLPKKKK